MSKFVETTENEAKDFEFTKLTSSERNSNEWYLSSALVRVIQDSGARLYLGYSEPNKDGYVTYVSSSSQGETIARSSDKQILTDFKNKIDDIKTKYQTDYDSYVSAIVREKTLLASIVSITNGILFGIDNLEKFEGECEYERSIK